MEMNSLLDFPIGTASAGQVDIMKVAGMSWECHILHKDLTTWSVLLCSAPKLSWGSVILKNQETHGQSQQHTFSLEIPMRRVPWICPYSWGSGRVA